MVEICANCGKISKDEQESFLCPNCSSHVSVHVPISIFKQMVKNGHASE